MIIYVITDRRLRPDLELDRLLETVVRSGADMVQIREKDLTANALLRAARAARAAGPRTEIYVNGRADVALAAGVTGVHLPARGLPASLIRSRWGARLRVGVSTHSLEEAAAAETMGADLITFGPVFATESKLSYGPPVGLPALRAVVAAARIPVLAIGGITPDRVAEVVKTGAAGVATISAVLGAADMAAAVGELRNRGAGSLAATNAAEGRAAG